MKTYLKLFWVFVKAQFCRVFLRKLNVSFVKVDGDWYCDIKGWPERFFPNALMVGDAGRLIEINSDGREYVTFEVIPSRIWLCPVTLFVLGRYPAYIYFRRVSACN